MADGEDRGGRDISASGDRYEALIEVLEHQAAQSAEDREREEEERRKLREAAPPKPWWLVAALGFIAAWLWLFPPAVLRIEPPPPPPVAEEEAALRFAMYVQAQQIKAYQQVRGSLPEELEEVGPPLPGMSYARLQPGLYQLTGRTERVRLTYRSDLPLREFVGSGATILAGAAEP